jgi:hypothetical protein
MIRSRMRPDHKVRVTHGALRPANIIVVRDGSGDAVAAINYIRFRSIVDWGNSCVHSEH